MNQVEQQEPPLTLVNKLVNTNTDQEKIELLQQLKRVLSNKDYNWLLDSVAQLAYLEVDSVPQVRQLWCQFLVEASVRAKNGVAFLMAQESCVRLFEDESPSVAVASIHSAGLLVLGGSQIVVEEKDVQQQKVIREGINELIKTLVDIVVENKSKLSIIFHALEECIQIAKGATATQRIVVSSCAVKPYIQLGRDGKNEYLLKEQVQQMVKRLCRVFQRCVDQPQLCLLLTRLLCQLVLERPIIFSQQVVYQLLETVKSLQQNEFGSSLKRQFKEGFVQLLKSKHLSIKTWQKSIYEVMVQLGFQTEADTAIKGRKRREARELHGKQKKDRQSTEVGQPSEERRANKRIKLNKEMTPKTRPINPQTQQLQQETSIQAVQSPNQVNQLQQPIHQIEDVQEQQGATQTSLFEGGQQQVVLVQEKKEESVEQQQVVLHEQKEEQMEDQEVLQDGVSLDKIQLDDNNKIVANAGESKKTQQDNQTMEVEIKQDQDDAMEDTSQKIQKKAEEDVSQKVDNESLNLDNNNQPPIGDGAPKAANETVEADVATQDKIQSVSLGQDKKEELERMREAARQEVLKVRELQQQQQQQHHQSVLDGGPQDGSLTPKAPGDFHPHFHTQPPRLGGRFDGDARFNNLGRGRGRKIKDQNQRVALQLQRKLKRGEHQDKPRLVFQPQFQQQLGPHYPRPHPHPRPHPPPRPQPPPPPHPPPPPFFFPNQNQPEQFVVPPFPPPQQFIHEQEQFVQPFPQLLQEQEQLAPAQFPPLPQQFLQEEPMPQVPPPPMPIPQPQPQPQLEPMPNHQEERQEQKPTVEVSPSYRQQQDMRRKVYEAASTLHSLSVELDVSKPLMEIFDQNTAIIDLITSLEPDTIAEVVLQSLLAASLDISFLDSYQESGQEQSQNKHDTYQDNTSPMEVDVGYHKPRHKDDGYHRHRDKDGGYNKHRDTDTGYNRIRNTNVTQTRVLSPDIDENISHPPYPRHREEETNQKPEWLKLQAQALEIRKKKPAKFSKERQKDILQQQITTTLQGNGDFLKWCWWGLDNLSSLIKKLPETKTHSRSKSKLGDKQHTLKVVERLNSIIAQSTLVQDGGSRQNQSEYEDYLMGVLNTIIARLDPNNIDIDQNPIKNILSGIFAIPFAKVTDYMETVAGRDEWSEVGFSCIHSLVMERWPSSLCLLERLLSMTKSDNTTIRIKAVGLVVQLNNRSEMADTIIEYAQSYLQELGTLVAEDELLPETGKLADKQVVEAGRLLYLYVELAGIHTSLLPVLFQYFAQTSKAGRLLIFQAKIMENTLALDTLIERVKTSSHLIQAISSFPEGADELVEHIGLKLSFSSNPHQILSIDLALAFWGLHQKTQDPKWTIPTVPYLHKILTQKEQESQLIREWIKLDSIHFNQLLFRLYLRNPNTQQAFAISPQDLIYQLIMITQDGQFKQLGKVTSAVLLCLEQSSVFTEGVVATVLHRIVYQNHRPQLLLWLIMHAYQSFPRLRRTIQNDYVKKVMNEPRVQLNLVLWRGILLFHLNNQLVEELFNLHDVLFQSHVWDWRASGTSKERKDNQNLRRALRQHLKLNPKLLSQISEAKRRTISQQDEN